MRVSVPLSLLPCIAACSSAPSEFGPDANQIAVTYGVPSAVKIMAAEMLHRCDVPARGRSIFFQWESRSGEVPYTLELSREQMANDAITACLKRQAKVLGVAGDIDLREEPPPPPE